MTDIREIPMNSTITSCRSCGNAVADRFAQTPTGNTACLECGYVAVQPHRQYLGDWDDRGYLPPTPGKVGA